MKTIQISIAGAAGRMGSSIISEAAKTRDIKIAGLYEKTGHALVGREVAGVEVCGNIKKASESADVIVDFTSPEATVSHARWCAKTGKAMIIGTTGFSSKQRKEIERAAKSFPCVIAPNMSIGINLLESVVAEAARKLGTDFDIEVVEAHHSAKTDAPSGTALALARAAAGARGKTLEKTAVCAREGTDNKRGKNEIGIQSIRGGDTPGDHTVFFLGRGERVEFSHKAHGREIFAAGAIKAVRWVGSKPAGIYEMKEVLGL
ncbi:MAG: 4-hydroxy-tetrahydrodipicolinate reductase [Candidatus Mycalebacterium zealandia]|nr:MAG: 4-hydroxy-tetrahydrodipicolinate reductase [Candidatus Mycalebacterium zealandia]